MKKRLMAGVAVAGLMAAMVPGVASAGEAPFLDGCVQEGGWQNYGQDYGLVDRNADTRICGKPLANGTIVWIDNVGPLYP